MPDAAGANTELREGTKTVGFQKAQLNREMRTVKHRKAGSELSAGNFVKMSKKYIHIKAV